MPIDPDAAHDPSLHTVAIARAHALRREAATAFWTGAAAVLLRGALALHRRLTVRRA